MLEVLSFEFVQKALIAAVLLSIAAGVIGTLVVANRIVFLSGSIAHATYGGIGIAFFFGFSPLLGAGIFGVFIALLMAFISLKMPHRSDTVIGALWAAGMAIGVIFTDFSPAYGVDLMSYLFGSMVAIDEKDLIAFAAIDAAIVVFAAVFYRRLAAIAFDDAFARTKGVKVAPLWTLLLVLSSLSIVIAIRVVGLMLVIALLTIPVWIAERFAKTLAQTFVISAFFTLFFCVFGFAIAYKLNITSSAAIVLTASTALVIFTITWKKP